MNRALKATSNRLKKMHIGRKHWSKFKISRKPNKIVMNLEVILKPKMIDWKKIIK